LGLRRVFLRVLLQQPLHDDHVTPVTFEPRVVSVGPDLTEAMPGAERARGRVLREDPRHQLGQACGTASLKEYGHERIAHAPASPVARREYSDARIQPTATPSRCVATRNGWAVRSANQPRTSEVVRS